MQNKPVQSEGDRPGSINNTISSAIFNANDLKNIKDTISLEDITEIKTDDNAIEESISDSTNSKTTKNNQVRRIMVFIALQLSLFLAALDGTIVATALPRIGSDFNRMDIVAWVATAYILPFDAFQPLFAKFSDIFGRKWILISGIGLFLVGSVLCGASQSMPMLIASRAIAGIGAASIFSMVFIVISDLVPLEQRGSYQGIINAVFALSSVFGPLIGGGFTDYVTWRWNFYINLPIGAIAMAMLVVFLDLPTPKENFKEKLRRVDYMGTLIVLVSTTLFLLAMNFGGQTFPWKSAAVIVPLVLTVPLIGLLVYVEGRFVKEPLMPPRLFKIRTVVCILTSNWFFGIVFYTFVYFLPVFFQVVRDDSAIWSGIRLIPMQMIACAVSSVVGVFISKTGIYKPLLITGMAILTVCAGLLSLLDENTDFSRIYGFTIIGGIGLGFLFASNIIGLQASVEPQDIAVVTGLGNFSRILGGALGVAISSAILNSSLTSDLPLHLPPDQVYMVISSAEYIRHGLPAQYVDATIAVYVAAFRLVWYVAVPMCGIGFIATLFITPHRIGQTKNDEKYSTPENITENVKETNDDFDTLTLDIPVPSKAHYK
ncbi:major facilitator superfamily domain-containing protein [Spinellus fusiger]|nr:major facilitator superfamily domain-containing protein [Spinellus fusiger]